MTHHSRSLYIIVKKTCRKRLTAFISTASRYSHASPDIICASRPLQAVFAHEAKVGQRLFFKNLVCERAGCEGRRPCRWPDCKAVESRETAGSGCGEVVCWNRLVARNQRSE